MHKLLQHTAFVVGLLAIVGLAGVCAAAQPADDPLAGDPFGSFGPSATGQDVTLSAKFTVSQDGNPARLFITATAPPDWHFYSITQPEKGPVRTTIKVDPSQDYRLTGEFRPIQEPERKPEPAFDNVIVETHYGPTTWYAPLELAPGVDPAGLTIAGTVRMMLCSAKGCKPPDAHPFTARLGAGMEVPAVLVPAISPSPVEPAVAPTAGAAQELHITLSAEDNALRKRSVLWAVFAGFLGGLILNIMPCVLPVIGLKILSFVEQSGHDRWRALSLNVWYSAGLLAVFVVLATLSVSLGLGWGELFSYSGFNITLTAIVFAMALSFLGVWEVPLPGFVGHGAASDMAAQEGAAGAFAKGALTTVLATPCSAPFLAPALFWMADKPAPMVYAVFISAGLGMASPYLLIGAYPQLIRFLPKPGEWMETFKQLMGFVLLGTVVFLLSFMAFANVVPTVALLFGLWASCWWIGRMAAGAEPGETARRWLEAVAFSGLVWIVAFPGTEGLLPSKLAFGGLSHYMQQRLDRPVFSRQALLSHVRAHKTVMVDFTADWCLSCKTFEAAVLHTDPVQEAIRRQGVVFMVADWTAREQAGDVNQMMLELNCKQVPVIAIFPAGKPDTPIVFRGGYTQQQLLEALKQAGPST